MEGRILSDFLNLKVKGPRQESNFKKKEKFLRSFYIVYLPNNALLIPTWQVNNVDGYKQHRS